MTTVENRKIKDIDALKRQIKALDMQFAEQEKHKAGSDPVNLLSRGFHEFLGREREDFASAFGFAISAAAMRMRETDLNILLCRLSGEQQEHGEIYACGLDAFGIPVRNLLCVDAQKEQELYWAAEEALRSNSLSAIIMTGSYREKLYNFNISRRLKLCSEDTITPLYFIRHRNQCSNTAAHARWRISRRSSDTDPLSTPDSKLIGETGFSLHMEKPVSSGSQFWEVDYDTACGLRLVPPLAHRPSGTQGTASRAARTARRI